MVLHLLLLWALLAGQLAEAAPAPPQYQAFCKAIWLLSRPCDEVATKLVNQIKAFSPAMGCDKCRYTLEFSSNYTIRSRHESLDTMQSEDVDFNLHRNTMTRGCQVFAKSASSDQTVLFDNGLNYCNLYDLLTGSGLDHDPGFKEMVNEWSCLGYSTAACRPSSFK